MTHLEHLLTILSEECAETAQRASKAIRFTMDEIQPGQNLTNGERLVYEFNDIVAVMETLHAGGHIPHVIDRHMVELKKDKLKKYLAYSQSLGVVK